MITLGISIRGYFDHYPLLVAIDDGFILTFGPLLLLFARSIMIKRFEFESSHILHFLPFAAVSLIIFCAILLSDPSSNGLDPNLLAFLEIAMLTHCIVYAIRARFEVRNALKTAIDNYSNIKTEHISWVKFIINSFLVILGTTIVHASTPLLKSNLALLISLSLFIIYLFYFVNRVVLKMLNKANKESGIITQTESKKKEKYSGSKIADDELKNYKKMISEVFAQSKPFLEDDITLSKLAETLGITPKRLSQVINSAYSMRFFDLINKHRITHALELISNADKKTSIQEVMYQSGFSSKSSFNAAFKKFTGKTPSAYKNALKKGATS